MSETRDQSPGIFRILFVLAGIYNVAFGLWAGLFPDLFFQWFEMAPPQYGIIWQCLGMVVGLYGVLYVYAAWRPDRATPIILVGLAGKILGPIGWTPAYLAALSRPIELLTGGAANGLYCVGGILLTLATRFRYGWLNTWSWAVWGFGLGLTVCALIDWVTGLVITTAVTMTLFCGWVFVMGYVYYGDEV